MVFILERLNVRKVRSSLISTFVPRAPASTFFNVGTDEYFGLIGQQDTGQGSQTIDAAGSAVAASTIVTGQGTITSDIVCTIASNAVVDTGQGSQTIDSIVLVPIFATVETGQAQTFDGVFPVHEFRRISPKGWLDAANVTTQPGSSFWQLNPRRQSDGLFSALLQDRVGDVSQTIANDSEFTVIPYSMFLDGFGVASVSHFASATAYPTGIAPGSFGTPTVYNLTQIVTCSGAAYGAIGTATIYNLSQIITCSGSAYGAFGTHTVAFPAATQNITCTGLNAGAFGTAAVINNARIVAADSLNSLAKYGTPTVQNANRSVYPSRIDPGLVGTHKIELFIRYITCSGFLDDSFGTPELIGPRYILPSGLDSLWMSVYNNHVDYFNRTIYPSSVIPEYFPPGFPRIANRNAYVYPLGMDQPEMFGAIVAIPPFGIIDCTDQGTDESAVGTPEVSFTAPGGINLYNKGISPGDFGTPTLFPHNIIVAGTNHITFGTTRIENWIRYVNPASLGVMVSFGDSWTSLYIRNVYPVGFDRSVVWDPFGPIDQDGIPGSVHGGPVTIYPEGFDASGTTYDNCGFPRIPQVPRPSVHT